MSTVRREASRPVWARHRMHPVGPGGQGRECAARLWGRRGECYLPTRARVVELADTRDLKSLGRKAVRVRAPPRAPASSGGWPGRPPPWLRRQERRGAGLLGGQGRKKRSPLVLRPGGFYVGATHPLHRGTSGSPLSQEGGASQGERADFPSGGSWRRRSSRLRLLPGAPFHGGAGSRAFRMKRSPNPKGAQGDKAWGCTFPPVAGLGSRVAGRKPVNPGHGAWAPAARAVVPVGASGGPSGPGYQGPETSGQKTGQERTGAARF